MKELKTKIKALLPVNSYFTLDDGEQSLVVYPTNHIKVTDGFISIEVATSVYGTITEDHNIMEAIAELYQLLTDYADTVEDYCSINPVLDDQTYRLNWCGVYIEQDSKDFDSVDSLINYLKLNK